MDMKEIYIYIYTYRFLFLCFYMIENIAWNRFYREGAYLTFPVRREAFLLWIADIGKTDGSDSYFASKNLAIHDLSRISTNGMALRLVAFFAFSFCLFRVSRTPLLSLLAANVPFFISNAYIIGTSLYNTIPNDFSLFF